MEQLTCYQASQRTEIPHDLTLQESKINKITFLINDAHKLEDYVMESRRNLIKDETLDKLDRC